MVSFWPWKGDTSSPASFEKTLSILSTRITDAQARLDRLRTNSRRVKVLWTLYLGFAYLVYAIVLLLVVGYKNLNAYEWAGMAGGPMLIYTTRAIISTYFTYHIDNASTRLKADQDERAKTIQKLKEATKYDSTMKLIEKYGGGNKQQSKNGDKSDETAADIPRGKSAALKKGAPNTTGRTNLPPPPTANIVRQEAAISNADARPRETHQQAGEDFAPNAYTNPPPAPRIHHQQYMTPETHWYDRIFDVLLGEDEAASKNRFALLCHACRLVNGQAPPGTKTLAEIGMWRCSGCGATNGEVDEGKRVMEEEVVVLASAEDEPGGPLEVDSAEAHQVGDEMLLDDNSATATDGPAGSVKARRRKAKEET